jgi:hypothetical protein
VKKTQCNYKQRSYVGAAEARLPMSAVVPVPAAAWPITDAVRTHVMAAQLKRTTDVFPSETRGTDPPV